MKKLKIFSKEIQIPKIEIKIENIEGLVENLPRFFAWKKHEKLRHSSYKGLVFTIKRLIKETLDIDIEKDARFKLTIKVINAVMMFKAKDLSKQPLRERDAIPSLKVVEILEELMKINTPETLQYATYLVISVSFALRSSDNANLNRSQIKIIPKYGKTNKRKAIELIQPTDKGNQGKMRDTTLKPNHLKSRSNSISDPVSIVEKYLSHLPEKTKENRFYPQCVKNKDFDHNKQIVWYTEGTVHGKNTLAGWLKIICINYGKMDVGETGEYNIKGHSGRVTTVVSCTEGDVNNRTIMDLTRHKSESVVDKYKRKSDIVTESITNALFPDNNNNNNNNNMMVVQMMQAQIQMMQTQIQMMQTQLIKLKYKHKNKKLKKDN